MRKAAAALPTTALPSFSQVARQQSLTESHDTKPASSRPMTIETID
jgi:hypothetical protein